MKAKRLYPIILAGGAGLASLVQAACSDSTGAGSRTLVGAEVAIGQGAAHIEAVVSNAGEPLSLAVELTESALQGLPMPATGPGPEFVIALPTGLTNNVFDHATLNWQPTGTRRSGRTTSRTSTCIGTCLRWPNGPRCCHRIRNSPRRLSCDREPRSSQRTTPVIPLAFRGWGRIGSTARRLSITAEHSRARSSTVSLTGSSRSSSP